MKKFIIVLCCLLFLVPSISHGVDYLVEDFDDWSYNHAMQSGDCGGYPGCKYYPADGFPSSSIPEASEWQNGNAGGSLGYCWVNPAAGECYGGSGKCYWHTWPGVSNSGDGFIHGYFGERDEIYIRYYSKLKDTSWSSSWGPTTGWKLFWLYATNYGQFCRVNFLKRFYHSKDAYALYVYAQGSYEVDTESFGYLSIVPTDWNCYEHQFKMNDVGQNNGIYRLWFNGVLTIEDTSVTYRNSSNQHFYKMEVMANAKVPTGPTSPAYDGGAMKEYMDELIISDSYIGPLGDDVTAPTLDSKVIAANGTTLTLGFSENANKGSGYSDADHNLDCSVTGNNIGLTYDSGDGTATWECIIASTIQDGETCNYDFDGDIEDDSGNDLEEIIDGSVTNNSTQGVDETPPATSGWSPEKSATGVDVDEDIEFHITDSGDGVDGTTIELIVEGVTYCCTDGSCANKTLSRSGTAADYTITYVHASWGYSQEINVSIDADDLASSPNSMTTDTYSFTTEAENDPPTPNPMEWYVPAGAPAEIEDPSALDMVAADASDVSLPIEYKFDYGESKTLCGADGGTGGTDSEWQEDPYYKDTGLQTNRCYEYRVQARDAIPNVGTASAFAKAYTSAAIPGAPVLSNPTNTTLDLWIDANGNPASNPTTLFAVRCIITDDVTWDNKWVDVSGDPTDVITWLSKAVWDAVTIRGLTPSTDYYIMVMSRNGDGVNTSSGEDGMGTTTGDFVPSVKGASGFWNQ